MKILAALVFMFVAASLTASQASPKAEIEALLGYVGRLPHARFIRNDSEHAAADAVAHLRLKWNKQTKRILTAEDFIVMCASKSSMSGLRYRIRFQDGSVRFCDEVLSQQLRVIRKGVDLVEM